jgi:hypothetical protein
MGNWSTVMNLRFLTIWLGTSLLATSAAAGQSGGTAVAPPALPSDAAPGHELRGPGAGEVNAAVARRFRALYDATAVLELTAKIEDSEGILHARSFMSKDRFRVEVYKEQHCIAALALVNGRVQEYIPSARLRSSHVPHLVIEYEASPEDAALARCGNPVVIPPDLGCRFGLLTTSWLAARPDEDPGQIERIAHRIETGTYVGKAEVGGRRCLLFRHATPRRIGPVVHLVYIDEETGDLRRQEMHSTATSPGSPPEVSWFRMDYDIVHHDALHDLDWTLDVERLRQPQNQAGAADERGPAGDISKDEVRGPGGIEITPACH